MVKILYKLQATVSGVYIAHIALLSGIDNVFLDLFHHIQIHKVR